MVFDRTNIVEQYRGLIGFLPSYDVSNLDAQIDDNLRQSLSGVYLNDLHEFFTPETFSNIAAQYNTYTVSSWSSSYTYPKGAVVSRSGVIYRATATTSNEQPEAGVNWVRTTMLSVWFQQKYDACVLAVIDGLMERNKLEGHGKELRGNTQLYNSEGLRTNTIAKSGRFVGYKIDSKQDNVAITLQRVGMQITEEMEVPLYVRYNNTEQVVPFTVSKANKFNYLNVSVPPFLHGNGDVIIGYYEDDLNTASAIGLVSGIFNESGCRSCGVDAAFRNAWEKWVGVTPISILNDEETADYSTNFGLNLVFSFRCDLSDLFIKEKYSVISALKAQLKVSFLSSIAETARNNQQADQTSVLAYNQLTDFDDPDNPKIALKSALKALSFEFSGINPACLPCSKNGRIVSRVI